MRTILRAGGIVGGVACVALAALQLEVALLVVLGIPVVGFIAGLCVAKWIERWWYGRQFEAGARTGLYACGLAACGCLAGLLLRGPHDLSTLAARSRLGPVSLAPVVNALTFFNWIGVEILIVLAALVAGIVLAAFTAQFFAWSKSGRTLRLVEQARLAASALFGDDDPAAAPVSTPPQGIPAAALLNRLPAAAFTGAPVPTSTPPLGLAAPRSTYGPLPSTQTPPPPPRRPTAAPADPQPTAARGRLARSPLDASDTAVQLTPEPVTAATGRRTRKSSSARPAEKQLTNAMKEALTAWASETLADENLAPEPAAKSRAPQPSTYLNSAPPAPKRNRKKNPTRDWIC